MVEMAFSTFLMNNVDRLPITLTMLKEKLPEVEAADLFFKMTKSSF